MKSEKAFFYLKPRNNLYYKYSYKIIIESSKYNQGVLLIDIDLKYGG